MKRRTITKILLFTLMLCIGVFPFIPVGAASEVLATVLFTNDTKGFTEELGFLQRYKECTRNCLLINCGNFTKGSAESSMSNAKYSSQLMHEAEYDIISLGTDDYAYGYRALKRYADYAQCTLLSGNVKYSSADVFAQNSIKTVNGVKIGFFSLVDSECLHYMPTARQSGYHFEEEIEFARSQIIALKNSCDKIVCMASFEENQHAFTPQKLLESVEGLDVLICSNTHQESNEMIGGTLVLSAKEQLGSAGKIEILANGSLRAEILPYCHYDAQGKPTEELTGTYRAFGDSLIYDTARGKIMESFEKSLDSSVAMNKTTIYGVHKKVDISQLEETPLGDLFADAMTLAGDKFKSGESKYKDYYVVSVCSGTAIQQNISSGEICIRDVFEARSIAEDVYFYECESDLLYHLMEKSVSEIKYDEETDFVYSPSKLFLQISGFYVVADPRKAPGERIEKMYMVDGDDEILIEKGDGKKFLMGVSQSFAKGFEYYDTFAGQHPVFVGDFLTNYLRTAIASNVSEEDYYISPGTEGRIAIKRIKQLQPNGDAWATIDHEYEDYAAAEVYVDGIDNMDCSQVDENGEVRITFKTGSHGVSVNGEDIYVSTVSGIGLKPGSITPIVDYKLYYRTLDAAYKIEEAQYAQEAVNGYFEYLGRAYVQTKLTEEGEVVKATQDILDVWDAFLEDPNSFIKKDDDDDAGDDDDDDESIYPDLSDFEYQGDFQSNVFENTPNTSYSKRLQEQKNRQNSVTNSQTGDILVWVLLVCSGALLLCAGSIGVYLIKKRKKG